ncbi:hypothetical protein KJ980_07775 [Patescibacteria group bacterium]|nr:hypothetical protein [Patescibacteria group bacterium]MBU4017101.1 hypothetical protein [Patescibacteria group bacterium]MBU4099518.1 hypothetical protein [Patescibacteria group bacterium]
MDNNNQFFPNQLPNHADKEYEQKNLSTVQDLSLRKPQVRKRFLLALFFLLLLVLFIQLIKLKGSSLHQGQNKAIIQPTTNIQQDNTKTGESAYDITTPPPGKLYCQSTRLGIIIEYPEYLICDENDEIILKRKNDESFVAPEIKIRPISKMYAHSDNFEKNILSWAHMSCFGDGPMGSSDGTIMMGGTSCPEESIILQKNHNKYNLEQYKIQRKIVAEAGGKVRWERKETVIFYKLDTPDYFTVMIYTDPQSSNPDIPNNLKNELLDIADSFRYLKNRN